MEELKHREAILKIFSQFHSSWMDDEDKKMFNETMLSMYGEELNHGLEEGVKKGFSVEQQVNATLDYLSKNPDVFGWSTTIDQWYKEKYGKSRDEMESLFCIMFYM